MPKKRDYGQFCPVAQTLDVIGDRWTILIVRELLLGPVRYGGLLSALTPIATDVLARRLREMEASGLITAVEDGYKLTGRGEQLTPVLQAMARWGTGGLQPPESTEDLTASRAIQWLILASPPGGQGDHEIEVSAGDLDATLVSTADGYRARRWPSGEAEASVVTDDATLWAVLASAADWRTALRAGTIVVDGDERIAEHMLAGRLPAPVTEFLDR